MQLLLLTLDVGYLLSASLRSSECVCIYIYLYIYIFLFKFFPIIGYYKILNLLQEIEYCSLCYIVGTCGFSNAAFKKAKFDKNTL